MTERTYRISVFADETDNRPHVADVTWEQLVGQLQATRPAACTVFDCVGSKCPHKLGASWSPAAYPPGARRGKKNVSAVSLLVLDLDHMNDAQILAIDAKLAPFQRLTHASHSDRADDRCLRTVIALDAPVSGEDWPRFRATALTQLGLTDDPDPSTKDASRIFFTPSRPASADFLFDANDGHPLSTSTILSLAPPLAPPEALVLPGAVAVASAETIQAAALELAAAWPAKGRHDAFLALAGGLALHGWPEDAITALTTQVARLMPGSDEKAVGHDRIAQASSSVAAVQRGEHVKGWGALAAVLTRPDVVKSVRERLGMRDAAEGVTDGFLAAIAAQAPPPPLSEGYPVASLDAIGLFSANQAAAVSGVTAAPGTFLAHLQQARIDVALALGASSESLDERPLFISARDLFAMSFPPTPWLVRGLIAAKGVGGLLAEAKSAKSWLALELAMSVASGTKALGEFEVPESVPTAYFFAEDMGPSIRNRLKAFAAGRGMKPEDLTKNLHVQPRGRNLDLTTDESVALVVASCRAIGAIGFLVLDPLRDIQTGVENDSDDMSAVFKRIKLIGTLLDCTVLVVHHASRAGKGKDGAAKKQDERRPGSDARGSSAIEGALDAIISLRDLRGNGTTEFTNTVVTQIKNAKSAGTFDLTLSIRDDANGQSEHAAWAVGSDVVARTDAVTLDQLVIAILEHMRKCEVKVEPPQTTEKLRKAVTRKYELVAAAMIEAERDAFVLKHLVGRKQAGWILTERGREHVSKANEPVRPPSSEAQIHVLADPRRADGFGLAGAIAPIVE